MALLFAADECTGRAAVLLTPHHTKFYLPWICPTLPSFSTSLPWTPTDTSVSPSQQSNHYCYHTYTCMLKTPPQNTPSVLPTTLYPFWAASSAPCSWIAVNQMLSAGWLSSNTAKFICLWFFLWDGLSRGQSSSSPSSQPLSSRDWRQQQTRLALANLKPSQQE